MTSLMINHKEIDIDNNRFLLYQLVGLGMTLFA